ncbi:MAG: DUF4040 domain-containing protein [Jaaginema sp. PMC 1079.18]|nr:DUF4040 domain-containing protein [Jaaginema sp. PMC 1080.18]MEC4853023.1 DUF4040 domain-containing protein [Jaaginema sp. PMC 1079.18]MEC4869175.1 DUF4040 domain-containing protein [Jaaginema sp. PMC 1078.18]
MNDSYIYVITALLPLTSLMLVVQTNPYHALVIRGVVGAVAALVYAVLGAADVALTEALVGTMLAIMLYAVAVRSSMVLRLGVITDNEDAIPDEDNYQDILQQLRPIIAQHHLKLELVGYPDEHTLQKALMTQEIHATYFKFDDTNSGKMITRVRHLYDIFQQELTGSGMELGYFEKEGIGQ